jgi:PAS domain S-box-containing protein
MNFSPDANNMLRRQSFDSAASGAAHEVSAGFMPLAPHTVSLDSLFMLASKMSDGVCLLSADNRIQFANPALRAMLARSEAELMGKRVDEFHQPAPGAPPAPESAQDDGGANHGPWAMDERARVCRWLRGDGSAFEARCALQPLEIGGEPSAALLLVTPIARPAQGGELDVALHLPREAAERWVEAIEAIADTALLRLPANEMIGEILNRICPALGLENAGVFLINAEGSALEARAVAGAGAEFARFVRVPVDAEILQGAMESREPVLVQGAGALLRESGLFSEALLASMTVESALLAPLVFEAQTIGLLYLGAREPNHFTDDDIRLARIASERIALAVEGTRAREAAAQARDEAARSQRRLVLLAEASEALVGPLDQTEIATRLVSLITPAFASACALYLVEDDGVIRRIAVSGPTAGSIATLGAPAQAASRALRRLPREIESFESLHLADQADGQLDGALAPVSINLIPVEAHGHPLGALYLIDGADRRLLPEDKTLIQGLARRAAVGMEIARLYAELQLTLKRVSEIAIQLDTIFDSTDAGIYVTDADGQFQRINTYGLRMLGLDEMSDLPAKGRLNTAFELRDERGNHIPPEEEPLHVARKRNQAIEQRVIIHRFDTGQDIPVLARCTPMRDGRGQVIGAVAVLMDITGIHELERQKDEFLGIVSHELKTPLTTLKILSQMLTRRMRASDAPHAHEQAERMTTAIVRMERLINDLLDVSRIQEGKLTLTMTVCDLGAICRDAAREQELINQRPIHLSLPDRESLPVHADIERLRQVVVNLLSNALKYSPPNSPVSLHVRESGGQYLVSVEDHGPGLSPDKRRRLFQRFYRAPGVQVQSGSGVGLGLGLYISREIVRNHGGDIWVESEPGHGSVFTFSIPRAGSSDGDTDE